FIQLVLRGLCSLHSSPPRRSSDLVSDPDRKCKEGCEKMYEYDEECLKTFLKKQGQLFDEPVAETLEEAEAFLEDCMAVIADSLRSEEHTSELQSRFDLVCRLLLET